MKKTDPASDGIARRDMLKLAGAAVVGMGGVALTAGPALGATGGAPPPEGITVLTLEADGIVKQFFGELVELRMAVERAEDRRAKPPFVAVLKAGILGADIYAWFADALAGKKTGKRSAKITGYDASFTPLIKWNLTGASPSEILSSSTPTGLQIQLTLVADLIAPG